MEGELQELGVSLVRLPSRYDQEIAEVGESKRKQR